MHASTSFIRSSRLTPTLSLALLAACGGSAAPPPPPPGDLRFTSVPSDPTYDRIALAAFEGATLARCQLDDGEAVPCESPFTLRGLTLGEHHLEVRSGDQAITHTFTVQSLFDPLHPALETTGPAAPGTDEAAFRIKCEVSHYSNDDAIVFPGEPGHAHLHMFLGNRTSDAFSTPDSLSLSGESSCQGSPLNRSSYWVPALVTPAHDAEGAPLLGEDGQQGFHVVPPDVGWEGPDVYYKSNLDDFEDIVPMPDGLRMIAGTASGNPDRPQSKDVMRWVCEDQLHAEFDRVAAGERGPITSDDYHDHIPRCLVGDRLQMFVHFPSCWDGVRLSAPDQGHMALPVGRMVDGAHRVVCPSTHPVALTQVTYSIHFPVTEELAHPVFGDTRGWRLSSDTYVVDDEHPGGYSLHGDWFMAWHPELAEVLVDSCIRTFSNCTSGDMGNGFRMSFMDMPPAVPPALVTATTLNGVPHTH